MPAERMFFNAYDGDGELVIDKAVRTGPGGRPGMGHKTFPPHTVRRASPFMACHTCHPIEGTGANMGRLMQVMGFGSDDFLETDGEGNVWALDRIQDEDYNSEVLVGHDAPVESRPLDRETVERMLSVEVPAP
jgi:hypothetical protein